MHYAIADVAAFVAPGGALDRESTRRGATLYLPDGRAPMLPDVLCEGAASLLADGDRPAVVWTIDLDSDGAATSTARRTGDDPQPCRAELHRRATAARRGHGGRAARAAS